MIVGAGGQCLEGKGYPLMRLRALSQYEGQASLDGLRDLGAWRSEYYVIGYLTQGLVNVG